MANFIKSMDELKALEFDNPLNVLHKNAGENGYTYFGIYQTAHPKWSGWREIYRMLKIHKMSRASHLLYKNQNLTRKVYSFYKDEFWDEMKLDFIHSQKIADELFIFGVNTNPRKAIRKAQKLIGVKVDGWIGQNTIKALNNYDAKKFDIEFDLIEIAYYKFISFVGKNRAKNRRFYRGWVNRAKAV